MSSPQLGKDIESKNNVRKIKEVSRRNESLTLTWASVIYGVPQGLVLGSILFSLFVMTYR